MINNGSILLKVRGGKTVDSTDFPFVGPPVEIRETSQSEIQLRPGDATDDYGMVGVAIYKIIDGSPVFDQWGGQVVYCASESGGIQVDLEFDTPYAVGAVPCSDNPPAGVIGVVGPLAAFTIPTPE